MLKWSGAINDSSGLEAPVFLTDSITLKADLTFNVPTTDAQGYIWPASCHGTTFAAHVLITGTITGSITVDFIFNSIVVYTVTLNDANRLASVSSPQALAAFNFYDVRISTLDASFTGSAKFTAGLSLAP